MASTFFGLNIAGSGLRAANAAMNTTANNIANADTEGYSRQKVVQQAANALRVFTTYGCAGAGVKTIAIERIRDEFYDTKYRENETVYGEYSTKNYYMQMVQKYFDDDGKTGFASLFTNLKVALQEVLKNAGESTAKQDYLGAATKLTEYFNTAAANLEKLQKDINSEIKTKIEEINSISQEIVTLNKQINVIELSGAQPNELRDKRDNLIDQLSKVVSVEVSELPIYDSNDPDRETGAHRYIVKIAGGQTLVDNDVRNELGCFAKEPSNKVNQTDIEGLYDVYWVDTDGTRLDKFSSSNSRIGGELQALFQLRDGNNNEYFHGNPAENGITAVSGPQTALDGSVYYTQQVKVDVTADYLMDFNKCNLAASGEIDIGNRIYNYTNWTLEVSVDEDGNETYSYIFDLKHEKAEDALDPDRDMTKKNASVGSAVNYQGIPYYMEQMSEWIRLFSRTLNSIFSSGYTDDGKEGCLMFTAEYPDAGSSNGDTRQGIFTTGEDVFSKDYPIDDTTGKYIEQTYQISATDDSYYRMTASGFTILDAVKRNAELLATKTQPNETDGESQYDNITLIVETLTDAKKLSFRGADAGEFLTCVLGDITLATDNAETFEENYLSLQNMLQNQRLSISGVDSDEEALSLVHYQDTYTLACKMISTFSEIYDQLILNTGV